MQPDTALRDKHVWEVDAAQPSLGWISPHPVCGLIHCGTCVIPSSVSLTPVLILRFSHLLKEAFTESPKPVIFLISLDIRLKKLVDERECLLEQVTIFFITFRVLEWGTWNWDPSHSSFLLHQETPDTSRLKTIIKPTSVLNVFIQVRHQKSYRT